jgi:hypothetical protein
MFEPMGENGAVSSHGRSGVVAVLCPMRIERAAVERAVRHAGLEKVRVIQTGIGREAVLAAIVRCAGGGLLVLAGACGGLVECGDVPPIAMVIDEHGERWTPFGSDANGVTLVGLDRIVSTPGDKRALAAATGAAVVDMESHAFAAECEKKGVAWAVVRGVSDTPEETLPAEVLGWITPEGNTRGVRAVLDMVRRPSLVPHIFGVLRRSNRVLPLVGERVVELVRAWREARMEATA